MALRRLSASQRNSLTQAADRYHEQGGRLAELYLKARGIEWWPGLDGFRLGVVVDPAPGHERFDGWLSIPYLTPSGVVDIKFRCLKDHDCKAVECIRYDKPAGLSNRLYNVQALHDASGLVYFTEGEINALHVTSAGYPCVGVSGGASWKPHWNAVFEDFTEVIGLCDGDETGRKMGERLVKELPNVRLVHFKPGVDADSFLVDNGVSAFHRLLFGAD